jgi:hypothetical protein
LNLFHPIRIKYGAANLLDDLVAGNMMADILTAD